VTSCPADEAAASKAVAEEAAAAVAEVQPKTRTRVRSSPATSSPAIVAEEAGAEAVAVQPKKRSRRSGPSASRPAIETAEEEEAVAQDAEAVAHNVAVVLGTIEDFSQQVDWEAVQQLKTFAGRYAPNTKDGAGTWVTRRILFYSLVPPYVYQTSKLQLSFWKYLSEKVRTGMSETDAARQFVREGRARAA
jgi:hypothetical protein